MALGAKLDDKHHRIFVLLSDGECDEGSNWEAILFASHHRLSNLCAIVDYNKIQSLKPVAETLGLEPFADKWIAFGWHVIEVDGHNHEELLEAFAQAARNVDGPTCILAHTVKGKGIPFMEHSVLWHYRTAKGDEFDAAVRALASEEDA
jgi:transketolase